MSSVDHPLTKVVLKVLEDWAMMLVDPVSSETQIFEIDQPLYLSQVHVSGVFEGYLSIVAQADFLKQLAANVLGQEGDELQLEGEGSDAFREMGNVLAGNFITEAYGDDVTFDILNPSVSKINSDQFNKIRASKITQYYKADDIPVCISFQIIK